MATSRLGFAEDGLTITDPAKVVTSVLFKLLNKQRKILLPAWRKPNQDPLYEPYNAQVEPYPSMLSESKIDNTKDYFKEDTVGLTRVSASAARNCCWFDAFLMCISPSYREKSFDLRESVRFAFREWCRTNVNAIIAQIPREIFSEAYGYPSDLYITQDLADTDTDIDAMTGLFIAWYFGVNCIYVYREARSTTPSIVCQSAYQSPECKTIIIYHSGNHFEPMGTFTVGANKHMTNAKFLFDWDDAELCQLKALSAVCNPAGSRLADVLPQWTNPQRCGGGAAAAGGNGTLMSPPGRTAQSSAEKAPGVNLTSPGAPGGANGVTKALNFTNAAAAGGNGGVPVVPSTKAKKSVQWRNTNANGQLANVGEFQRNEQNRRMFPTRRNLITYQNAMRTFGPQIAAKKQQLIQEGKYSPENPNALMNFIETLNYNNNNSGGGAAAAGGGGGGAAEQQGGRRRHTRTVKRRRTMKRRSTRKGYKGRNGRK